MSKEKYSTMPLPTGKNIKVVQRERRNYASERQRQFTSLTHPVQSVKNEPQQSNYNTNQFSKGSLASMAQPNFNPNIQYNHPPPNFQMNNPRPSMPFLQTNTPFSFYQPMPSQAGHMNPPPVFHSAQGVPHILVPVPVPFGPNMPMPPQINFPPFVAQQSPNMNLTDYIREPVKKASEELNYFLRRGNEGATSRERSFNRGRSPHHRASRSERSRSLDSGTNSWYSEGSVSSHERSYHRRSRRRESPLTRIKTERYSRSPVRRRCSRSSVDSRRSWQSRSPIPQRRSRSRERYNRSHSPVHHRRSRSSHCRYSRSPLPSLDSISSAQQDERHNRRSSEFGDRDTNTDNLHSIHESSKDVESQYGRGSVKIKNNFNVNRSEDDRRSKTFESVRYSEHGEVRESRGFRDPLKHYQKTREPIAESSNQVDNKYRAVEKRKLSPVSVGDHFSSRSSSKHRRDYSPVSGGSAELKIHVSDEGRWIETNKDLSPVSDRDSVHGRSRGQRDERVRLIENGNELDSVHGRRRGQRDKPVRLIENGKELPNEAEKSRHTKLLEDGFDINHQAGVRLIEDGIEVSERTDTERRRMVDDLVIVSDIPHKTTLNVDVDLVSDSESIINDRYDELRIHATNLSPVSLNRSREHSEFRRDGKHVDSKNQSPTYRKSYVSPPRSYHSRHSNKRQKTSRDRSFSPVFENRSQFKSENHEFKDKNFKPKFEQRQYREHQESKHVPLKVPDLCSYHNSSKAGCEVRTCGKLHICEHFIASQCKFGDWCTKSHDFFIGQSYDLLCRFNSGLVKTKETYDEIFDQLYKRLSAGKIFDKLLNMRFPIRDGHKKYKASGVISSNEKVIPSVTKVDPSFDARTYRNTLDPSIANQNLSRADENSTANIEVLSPVSVEDVDNWETYDKYERVSESGMSEIDALHRSKDLENVSSNSSNDDMNASLQFLKSFQKQVAVPIGMNDPLVFSNPAGNQQPKKEHFPGINVPLPQPGGMKNHLPSPELLQKVIQSLPSYQYPQLNPSQQSEQQSPVNVNETEMKPVTTCKEYDTDPELKEPIKAIWTFPHKGILHLSVIEFVTETEAYKEEFVAEIVRLLLTLDLPYVTMKKLIMVIRENISVNIKSAIDLRKILELYPDNFEIIETVDSGDEDDDMGVRKSVQIKAKVNIGFCEKHGYLPFAEGKCDCNSFHICKFYLLSSCSNKACKFGHKLKTDHNITVLKQHKLHRMTGEEIISYLRDIDNRTVETIPGICRFYNRTNGCYKGDGTDSADICHNLHMCYYKVKGMCSLRNCAKSHSIYDKQPLSLLQKYGLDPAEQGDEKIIEMLSEKALQMDKDKKKKNAPFENTSEKSTASRSTSNVVVLKQVNEIAGSSSRIGNNQTEKKNPNVKSKYKKTNVSPIKYNPKVPVVCRFYNNELGCKKKDWGPEGFCYFLHVCQFYILGNCKFGDKCKRSHDLVSGQAALLLHKYGIETNRLSVEEILQMLNKTTGMPMEIPPKEEVIVIDSDDTNEPESEELGTSTAVISKKEGNEIVRLKSSSKKSANAGQSNKGGATSFRSCNVEDVIKHIMEQNKVDEKVIAKTYNEDCAKMGTGKSSNGSGDEDKYDIIDVDNDADKDNTEKQEDTRELRNRTIEMKEGVKVVSSSSVDPDTNKRSGKTVQRKQTRMQRKRALLAQQAVDDRKRVAENV